MNVPSLETSSFFAGNSASGQATLGSGMGEIWPSGSGEGRRFGVQVQVQVLHPPTVTHPDALHHGDVLVLVRLEGDPAGAGGPAHGVFSPSRVLAWTHYHFRPHAHKRAWTCPDVCLEEREQGHDPKRQGERAGPQFPPPPVTLHNKMPLVGGRYEWPASTRQKHLHWLPQTRMLWQQVVFDTFPEPLGIVGIVVSIWRQARWNLRVLI